jgi:hypothetical protein
VAPKSFGFDQAEPFHTQVASESWPSASRPPNMTTLESASS